MPSVPQPITSLQNPGVKEIVKLRQRSHRDENALLIVEGYRETKRALDNGIPIRKLFFCPALYQGKNEPAIVARCAELNVPLWECSEAVFRKIAYRDRPEGLLALCPQIRRTLADLRLPKNPFIVVAEHIEKPGNLGTMLRTADAAGVDAFIVCDRCTDINNPNVVRASIGTLFTVQVAEASTPETIAWLATHQIRVVAATPHATQLYTAVDMTKPVAIILGAEQFGLSDTWLAKATDQVRIPMLGQADSLNVAAAATILLYEVVRQRQPAAST
ncbi:MAG TPA: RNA methyltransferase [Kiritimatiellia bacterium]|jgi:TrmH family RNA methyltransferase|nr:RNA methyltransferase [Kiritimatiellia bacterium]OQC59009.1 MAG: 23S rRNA (uridine(2479)-2'-O)-methyltransferase [Verrucomicrobia bacterium ADurb.Bin018]MBP9572234.1 RNA methyltransferase [Kiritimatiellia bacterium]HOE00778.1 RNA methyltransferase [Kiritimatiellia bacterium]HOE37452.1 RNA methyltransferase [Kiritimatiellia bacterium]